MTATTEDDVLGDPIELLEIENSVSESEGEATPATEKEGEPLIKVLKGSPTDVELAALVAVLTAAAAAAPNGSSGSAQPPDLWGSPTFMHRGSPPFSPYSFPHLSHLRD